MSVAIALTRVELKLEGISPGVLFQSKGIMEADEGTSRRPKRTKEEEARLHGHWMDNGRKQVMCIPWTMLHLSFCQAAASFKFPANKKKSMGTYVGSTLACEVDKISLGTSKFITIDEYVRIPPRTGAMVKVGRPLVKDWKITVPMLVDDEDYPVDLLKDIIKEAGKNVGIGAWRPGLTGAYGKYRISQFKVLD